MKRLVVLVALLAIVFPAATNAAIVTRRDLAGRLITFDVPANMNVNTFASALRGSLHADEIETVTIRVVGRSTLARLCGRGMASCYRSSWRRGGEILLPARDDTAARYLLLHEYAHHLDATYGLTSSWRWEPAAERWWRARRIEQRLRRGEVAWDYELGWQRSIDEILAEDYVQLHARAPFGIRWLPPPNRTVLLALRRDIREALRAG